MKFENGVDIREVSITVSGGTPLEIFQISDVHFNIINEKDREENHELVMASYNDDVLWLKEGASRVKLQNCLECAGGADQIVVTGDVCSYLSYGNLELLKKHLFDPYPDILVCAGNHDPLRSWRAAVDERDTLDERLTILEKHWLHDIYYTSKVIDDRVMIIQLDNALKSEYGGSEAFWDRQVEPLRRDLCEARVKGYAVLLFYHIPISSGNETDAAVKPIGTRGVTANLFSGNIVGGHSVGASKEIYEMIVNNGDIIKGAFCGHMHADYYTEIKARTKDGEECVIPQYVLSAMPYGEGQALRILIDK